MKISAIIGRGTKKDFIDIAFLLQRFSAAARNIPMLRQKLRQMFLRIIASKIFLSQAMQMIYLIL